MIFTIKSDIILTTSRKPSQITRRFVQFLKHYFNAVYINRGKSSFKKIINQVPEENSLLIVITETKGNPSSINIYNIKKDIENPEISIYINVSLATNKNKIQVNYDEITFINKSKALNELNNFFTQIKPTEKIKKNYVNIQDINETTNKHNKAIITFFDKKGLDTQYKIYVKNYKINKQLCD
ncbi:hypothetical protein [Methanosphaera sp. WGK6]|uniref:hypothetical protein n=1 Tax=Methanosphaera sp. WGK6 TaxID=1561964 RepID=UPI00084C908B|nr:hypothetical protein [Methanosphaera sp. WGK6]